MKKTYTVQLGWWTLAVVNRQVEASSPEEACHIALEDPDDGAQETIYDCCTDTKVLELAEGEFDCAVSAPESAHRPIPPEHRDALMGPASVVDAAPDMLAALKGLFEHCAMVHARWGDGSNQKEADAAIEAGRAAIAKAEGKKKNEILIDTPQK